MCAGVFSSDGSSGRLQFGNKSLVGVVLHVWTGIESRRRVHLGSSLLLGCINEPVKIGYYLGEPGVATRLSAPQSPENRLRYSGFVDSPTGRRAPDELDLRMSAVPSIGPWRWLLVIVPEPPELPTPNR
jgi:hypothetical protein